MNKRISKLINIGILSTLAVLSACTNTAPEPELEKFGKYYQVKAGEDSSTLFGYPWIASIYEGSLSKIVKPSLKDDFYASVNYEKINAMKEYDYGNNGTFEECAVKVDELAESIFTIDDVEDKASVLTAQNLVSLAMNEKEQDRIDFVTSNVQTILSLESIDQLFTYLASKESMYSSINYAEMSYYYGYNITSYSSELYYRFDDKDFKERIINFMEKNLASLELSDYEFMYEKALETEAYIVNKTGYTYDGVFSRLGGFNDYYFQYYLKNYPFKNLFKDLGYNGTDTVWIDYEFFDNLGSLLKNMPFEEVKNHLVIMYLAKMTGWFEPKAHEENSAEHIMNYYDQLFPLLFENAYIEVSYNEEKMTFMNDLIHKVLVSYRDLLSKEPWLDTKTIEGALKKIDKMRFSTCLPKTFSIDDLDISMCKSYLEAYQIINKWTVNKYINFINRTENYPFWDMTCYTTNAFYDPSSNKFTILDGICHEPILDLSASTENILGHIGSVIAHEISHAFDNDGSLYDEYGLRKLWWSNESRARFINKCNNIVEAYKKIKVLSDETFDYDGERLLGETIADLGAVRCMLNIASDIEGFNYDEFFRAYADLWAEKLDGYSYESLTRGDAHPLAFLRTNFVLSQFEKFHETYDIKPGDGMYTHPTSSLAIW